MPLILAIDPGPETHGAVVYDSDARRVLWARKAATTSEVLYIGGFYLVSMALMERPAAMGLIGVGMAQHMLDTAWAAGWMVSTLNLRGIATEYMTRREVLRHLGVLSGKGSSDARVRAACIADHGGSKRVAVGRKAEPGPLHGVVSHAWQALGLCLAWLERQGGEQ